LYRKDITRANQLRRICGYLVIFIVVAQPFFYPHKGLFSACGANPHIFNKNKLNFVGIPHFYFDFPHFMLAFFTNEDKRVDFL